MSKSDRCLTRLEELEIENQTLKQKNTELGQKVLYLTSENEECKAKLKAYQITIERWGQSDAD